jgi:excisionase family DNA binding protein
MTRTAASSRNSANGLVTVGEAAAALALSVHTIRMWIATRRIGCVKLGRAVRIPMSEIDRLVEWGKVPARDTHGPRGPQGAA